MVSSNPLSPYYIDTSWLTTNTDAVQDMNVVVTKDANWCEDLVGTNHNKVTGAVHMYAKTGVDKGLYIYNGLDLDYIEDTGSSHFMRELWINELKQPWNPSNLPCGATVVV